MEDADNKQAHTPTRFDGGNVHGGGDDDDDGGGGGDDNQFGYDDHRREYYDHGREAGPLVSSYSRGSVFTADDEGTNDKDYQRRRTARGDPNWEVDRKKKKKALGEEATDTGLSDDEKERRSKVTPSPRSSSAARVDRTRRRGDDDEDQIWEEEQDDGGDNAGVDATPSLHSTSDRKGPRLLFPPSHPRRRSSSSRPQHGSKAKGNKQKRVLAQSFSDSLLSSDIQGDSGAAWSVSTAYTNDAESQGRVKVAPNTSGSTKKSTRSLTEQRSRQRRCLGGMDSLARVLPPPKKTQQQSSLSEANRPDESNYSSFRPVPSAGKRGPGPGRPRINYSKDQRYITIPRRGPGRPRKLPVVASQRVENQDKDHLEFKPRRGRGRPRKNQQKVIVQSRETIRIGVDSHDHASGVNDRPGVNDSNPKDNRCSNIPSDLLPLFDPPKPTTRAKPRSAEQILEDVRVQEDENRQKRAMERRQRRFKLIRSAARRRGGEKGVYVGSQHLDHDHDEDEASRHGGASTISRPWLERACKTRTSIDYNEESDENDNNKSADEGDYLNRVEEGRDLKKHGLHAKPSTAPNLASQNPIYHDGLFTDDHDLSVRGSPRKRQSRSPKTLSAFERMADPFDTSSQQRSKKNERFSKSKLINDTQARPSTFSLNSAFHGPQQDNHRVGNHGSERYCEDSVFDESASDVMDFGFSQQHSVKRGSDMRYKDDTRSDPTAKDHGSLSHIRNRSKGKRSHDKYVGDRQYPYGLSNSPPPKSSSSNHRHNQQPSGSSSRRESTKRRREEKEISSNSRSPSRKKRVRFEITKPDGTRIKFRCDAGVDSSSNAAVQAAIAVLAGTSQTKLDSQNSSNTTQQSEEHSQNKGELSGKTHRRGIDATVSDSRRLNANNQQSEETENHVSSSQSHHILFEGNNRDSCSVTSELTHHWNADERSRRNKLRVDDDIRDSAKNSNTNIIDSGENDPTKYSIGDTLSQLQSSTRHGRRWDCMDSLAGSYANFSESYSRAAGTNSQKLHVHLPKNVSVPSKTNYNHSSKTHQNMNLHVSDNEWSRSVLTRETRRPNPSLLARSRKRSLATSSSGYRCGRCPGCSRTTDCQTCESCLGQLRHKGPGTNYSDDRRHSGCLQRRCHRARRFNKFDSLMSVASNASQMSSKNDCVDNLSKKTTSSHESQAWCDDNMAEPNGDGNSEIETGDGAQSKIQSNVKTTKTTLEDNDDWSVDYSYLSEPEYRSKWRQQQRLQRRRLSSSNSVSSLPRLGGRVMGTVASLSTISASIRPKLHSSFIDFDGGQPPKRGPGRPRGQTSTKKKQLKSPPLELACLKGGSASVESRKCLRELMEYDEEDQEWV